MQFVVGVHTFNAIKFGRMDLLKQTIASARIAFTDASVSIVDNGSDDGTDKWVVSQVGGVDRFRKPPREDTSPGHGTSLTARWMMLKIVVNRFELHETVVVLSDDDMLWRPEAGAQLAAFWAEAPADLGILCAYLEPEWYWNTPRRVIEAGGVRVLVRDTVPAAAWTFRADRWPVIEPLLEDGWQFDTHVCDKLAAKGYCVAEVDLATHEGWEKSTHENRSIDYARPLDRKRWGV